MLSEGQLAPHFELADLNGAVHTLASLLADGPVIIVLFKVSCPVCQLALPFLDRLGRDGTVRVVPVSQDDADTTRQFNRLLHIHLPMLVDPEPYRVSDAFGIESVPSIFLIEPDGHIAKAFTGFSKVDFEDLGRRGDIAPLFRPDENVPAWKAG